MTLKETVDEFLQTNFEQIENWRTNLPNFRWKLVSDEIGEGLSPEYIRGRHRKIRDLKDLNLLEKDYKPNVLYADIEIGFNICYSWQIGNKIRLSPDNILEERKIICISYSWGGEKEVKTLIAHKGDEYKMLQEFAKLAEKADIIVGHNLDEFDIKHIRTRCIYLGIPFPTKINTIDTLKLARRNFRFNSNKLDYLAQFLGVGEKEDTGGIELWKQIVLYNNKEALKKMVLYCENDVVILKKVHKKLQEFVPTHNFRRLKAKELILIK